MSSQLLCQFGEHFEHHSRMTLTDIGDPLNMRREETWWESRVRDKVEFRRKLVQFWECWIWSAGHTPKQRQSVTRLLKRGDGDWWILCEDSRWNCERWKQDFQLSFQEAKLNFVLSSTASKISWSPVTSVFLNLGRFVT